MVVSIECGQQIKYRAANPNWRHESWFWEHGLDDFRSPDSIEAGSPELVMHTVSCPEEGCGRTTGLTLTGEPGTSPDLACPAGHRSPYPVDWPSWWDELTSRPEFLPHPPTGQESRA